MSPSAGRGLEVPSPNEMAEAAVLAWVRGPGTAWKALPCASVGCSVRDVIYRHCEEQVRIAVPGSGGRKDHQAKLGSSWVLLFSEHFGF